MIWATGISLLVFAASLPLSEARELDVDVPPITYPHAGTHWYTGEAHHVKWNTNGTPPEVTNPLGKIYLVVDGRIDFDYELADGFPLDAGQVQITVPAVPHGTYKIVLLGDSGNDSDAFEIN